MATINLSELLSSVDFNETTNALLRTWATPVLLSFNTADAPTAPNPTNFQQLANFLLNPFFSYSLQPTASSQSYPLQSSESFGQTALPATLVSLHLVAHTVQVCSAPWQATTPGPPPSLLADFPEPSLHLCFFIPSLQMVHWRAVCLPPPKNTQTYEPFLLKIAANTTPQPPIPSFLAPSLTYRNLNLTPILGPDSVSTIDSRTFSTKNETLTLTAFHNQPSQLLFHPHLCPLTVAASIYAEPNQRYPFELAIGLFSAFIPDGATPPNPPARHHNAYAQYLHIPLDHPDNAPKEFSTAIQSLLEQLVDRSNIHVRLALLC